VPWKAQRLPFHLFDITEDGCMCVKGGSVDLDDAQLRADDVTWRYSKLPRGCGWWANSGLLCWSAWRAETILASGS